MKALLVPLLLAASSSALAETVAIDNLFGCDTVATQKMKLQFLRTVTNCASSNCKPGTAELSYANYNYLQQNHCRRVPAGRYQVLEQASVPGGRVVRVKSNGELLWVLD